LGYDGQGSFLRDRICTTFLTGPADPHELVIVGPDRVLGIAEVRLQSRDELVEPGFSRRRCRLGGGLCRPKDYTFSYNFCTALDAIDAIFTTRQLAETPLFAQDSGSC